MRIDVFFSDRVRIAQEVLAELAGGLQRHRGRGGPAHIFIGLGRLDALRASNIC